MSWREITVLRLLGDPEGPGGPEAWPRGSADGINLALTLRGFVRARAERLPFVTPSVYVSTDRARELARAATDRIESVIDLGETARDGLGFNPVRPLAFRLLHFFAYATFVVEVLDAAADRVGGILRVELLGSGSAVDAVFRVPNVLEEIVSTWCAARRLTLLRGRGEPGARLEGVEPPRPPSAGGLGIFRRLRRLGGLLRLALDWARYLVRHRRCAFVDAAYDLRCLTSAREPGPGIRWIDLNVWLERLNGVGGSAGRAARRCQGDLRRWWRARAVEPEMRRLLAHGGIDLTTIVARYWERLIADDLDDGLTAFVQTRRIFSRGGRPAAFVTLGRGAAARGAWAAEAATAAGVPCIGVPHGGAVGCVDLPRHRIHYRDLALMAHYGPAAGLPEACALREVGVGSPLLARRLRPVARIPESTGRGPLIWCWTAAREVAVDGWIASWDRLLVPRFEVLRGLAASDLRLVVKPFPWTSYRDVMLEAAETEFPAVRFERERPFGDLMDEADVLLVEYPSTPLIEALCTTKPILYFAASDVFAYRPGALDLLRRRCAVFDTADDFVEGMQRYLKDPESVLGTADVRDTAFRDAYARPVSEAEFREGLTRAVAEVAGA